MLGEIAMGLSSLKAASDILKGLHAANTQSLINEIKISLQTHILDAQQALTAAQEAQTALTERVRHLEKQLAEFDKWETEKQRYILTKLPPGAFAYALKPEAAAGEPAHYLCANCYAQNKKSILQSSGTIGGREQFECHSCQSKISVGEYQPPPSRGRGMVSDGIV